MTFLEVTVLVTRWAHVIATVAWVGGNIFYLAALRPAMRNHPPGSTDLPRVIGERFKRIVDLSMWVLIITGALLIYDRLTQQIALDYAVILGIKLALSAAMFLIAFSIGRRASRRLVSPTNTLLILGPIVILLGLLLRFIGG